MKFKDIRIGESSQDCKENCAKLRNKLLIFRCQINLQNGAPISPESARSDIALHISIRPSENAIIRNHLKSQVWGQEERSHYLIQPNQSFEVMIDVDQSFYRIYVNGAFISNFHFRLPQHETKYIQVTGTVVIAYILLEHGGHGHQPINPHPINPPVVRPPIRHYPPTAPPVRHYPPTIPPVRHVPPPPPPMTPHYPIHVVRPPPPPYPGFYPHPAEGHATPYTAFQDELKFKMSHLRHHESK